MPRNYALIMFKMHEWARELPLKERTAVTGYIKRNLEAWEFGARAVMSEFNEMDFHQTILSLAHLGITPSREFINQLEDYNKPRLARQSDLQLTNYAWAFNTLRLRPSESFFDAWQKEVIKRFKNWNEPRLKSVLMGVAGFGMLPTETFLYAWKKRVEKLDVITSPDDVVVMLHALAIMDSIRPDKTNRKTAALLNDHIKDNNFPLDLGLAFHRSLYDSRLWFELESNIVPPPEDDNNHSIAEDRLGNVFRRTSLPLFEKRMQGTGHKVNFALNQKSPIYMELDGIHKFVERYDGDKRQKFYDGPTIFQSAIMLKQEPGSKILRLPYDSADRIIDRAGDEPGRTLTGIYNQMRESRPGCYRLYAAQNNGVVISPLSSLYPV